MATNSTSAAASSGKTFARPRLSAAASEAEIKERAILVWIDRKFAINFDSLDHARRVAARNQEAGRMLKEATEAYKSLAIVPDYLVGELPLDVKNAWDDALVEKDRVEADRNQQKAAALQAYQTALQSIDVRCDAILARQPQLAQILLSPANFVSVPTSTELARFFPDPKRARVAQRLLEQRVRVAACRARPTGKWVYPHPGPQEWQELDAMVDKEMEADRDIDEEARGRALRIGRALTGNDLSA